MEIWSMLKSKKLSFSVVVLGLIFSFDIFALTGCKKKETTGESVFLFSAAEKAQIEDNFNKYASAEVIIHAQVSYNPENKKTDNPPFAVGFLYNTDFDQKGKIVSNPSRALTPGASFFSEKTLLSFQTLAEHSDGSFEVGLPVKKLNNGNAVIPAGFFVYSDSPVKVLGIKIEEAKLGFDYAGAHPVYYAMPQGGEILYNPSEGIDFSQGSGIFSYNAAIIPEIQITLNDNPEYKTKEGRYVYVNLEAGSDKFQINNVPSAKTLSIPVSILNKAFPKIKITQNEKCVSALIIKGMDNSPKVYEDVLTPLNADPGIVLSYKTENWRNPDYEVFRWDRYPEILIMDFKTFECQAKFLKRMAFFVEKTGFKGRLVTNEEFKNLHGFNANDYKAVDFARFYNLADETCFKLNPEEIILKKYLVNNGILGLKEDGSVYAIKGGIATASRQSGTATEARLFNHEVLHTLFFIDEGYRNHVAKTYDYFDSDTKQFLIDYFDANPQWNYDTNDEYLMLNEYMSYIMEHNKDDVGPFFVNRAKNYANVKNYTPVLSQYIVDTNGKGFTDAAKAMEEYTFAKFGLVAGNVGLIKKY